MPVTAITGRVAWQQVNQTLSSGTQVLRWRYTKDDMGSSGLDRAWVDQVSYTPLNGRPMIFVRDAGFGMRSNRFGFNASGGPGHMAVVEASTNLSIWLSLQTNTPSSGSFYFIDPAAGVDPQRFYRVRQ